MKKLRMGFKIIFCHNKQLLFHFPISLLESPHVGEEAVP